MQVRRHLSRVETGIGLVAELLLEHLVLEPGTQDDGRPLDHLLAEHSNGTLLHEVLTPLAEEGIVDDGEGRPGT